MALETHRSFFLKAPEALRKLDVNQKPLFGEMNAVEMVDHLLTGMKLFLSKTETALETPQEFLPKYRAFLMSDKGFKPGAKKPHGYQKYESANAHDLEALKRAFNSMLKEFDEITATDPEFWSFHPSFGKLNAEETRQLHFKHLRHHLRQFGLMD